MHRLPLWTALIWATILFGAELTLSTGGGGSGSGSGSRKVYDVCTIGGGASGSFASVFLKDAGLDVLLLDSANTIGGHCDTLTDPTNPNVWNEAGVVILLNTTMANAMGFGPFVVDLPGLVRRFAGPRSIIPQPFADVSAFVADVGRSIFLGAVTPPATPTPAFLEQAARYQVLMNTTLRWMDNMVEVPNPIPADLRVSMKEWIVRNNFTALYPIFLATLFYAGFGDLDSLTAFDGLIQRSSSNFMYTLFPRSWFSVRRGCQTVYDGIADYLGPQSLLLGATVTEVTRPRSKHSSAPVRIQGTRNGVPFQKRCRALLMAIPQTIEKLDPILDLSLFERLVFSTVRTRSLYTGRFYATGGIASGAAGYALTNVDTVNPMNLPSLPNMMGVLSPFFPTGPVVHQDFFPTPVTPSFAAAFIKSKMDNLTASGAIGNYTGLASWLHELGPHWSRSFLGSPIAPHNLFDALQGERKTFNVGATRTTANTHTVVDYAKRVVDDIIRFLEGEEDGDEDSRRRSDESSAQVGSVPGPTGRYRSQSLRVDPEAVAEYMRSLSNAASLRSLPHLGRP